MDGKRTAIVLGAGSSYCYEDGKSNFPTQNDILERMVSGITTTSVGAPDFGDDTGLKHSHSLSQYLRAKFDIPEEKSKGHTPSDFWLKLQQRGFTLETLYAEIEKDLIDAEKRGTPGKWALEDFEAMVRSRVTSPNHPRDRKTVCRYHRMLCEALEPGDYIINFNWDTLMADALLYYSHFWFPGTGFGLDLLYPMLKPCQKRTRIPSVIRLYHVHGSICLFELDHQTEKFGQPNTLYWGPKTQTYMGSLSILEKVQKDENGKIKATRNASDDEIRRNKLGHMYLDDHWFRPIFVPPSKYKREYSHWYSVVMRRDIHSSLPKTKKIIIAGYSFPAADIDHLSDIFVRNIIPSKAEIVIIDPLNQNESFQNRVARVFPKMEKIDYSVQDFREFCLALPTTKDLEL